MTLVLTSPAFADGEKLSDKYARMTRNISPPLRWGGVPEGTRSLALMLEDPDAPQGTFHHWCLFNLPADCEALTENAEQGPDRDKLRVAKNDFGNTHYDGPQPPEGDPPHRYRFRLVALDVPSVSIPAAAGAENVWAEVEKHAIEEARIEGTFAR